MSQNPGRFVSWAAIDPASSSTAYAIFGPYPDALMLRTTDGGASWANANRPNCYGPQAVLFTETSHTLYAACNGTMFRTSDGTQSWTVIPDAGLDIRGLFWAPGARLMVGTDQGLHATSDDGLTWSSLSPDVSVSLLTGVAVSGNVIFTAVQDFNPIVSFDGGSSWQEPVAIGSPSPPVGEDGQVLINPGNPQYCYAYTVVRYQYSLDGCHTFTSAYAGQQTGGTNMIAVDPSDPATVYVASSTGAYRSTNWGVTMVPLSWPIPGQLMSLVVDPIESGTIYVGATSGFWRTLDGGLTWSQSSLAPATGFPVAIAVDPTYPQLVLLALSNGAGRGGGVVKSTDRGETFRQVNSGLPTVARGYACCGRDNYALRFNSVGQVALATTAGTFVSTDRGEHWQNVTGDAITSFATDILWEEGYLYVATFGSGVLRAPVSFAPSTSQRRRPEP